MTCSSCFVQLLDNANPQLRIDLYKQLNNHLAVPFDEFQYEFSLFAEKINLYTDAYNDYVNNLDFASGLMTDLQAAAAVEGFTPGVCPQYDFLVGQIGNFQSLVLGHLKQPLGEQISNLTSFFNSLQTGIAMMNDLISNAEGLKC